MRGEGQLTVTCGGVVFVPGSPGPLYFGLQVPDHVVEEWRSHGISRVVGQAELLPVLLCKLSLKSHLSGQRVIFFLDNDGARESLIRGNTCASASVKMLLECASAEAQLSSHSWYARVPSESNVADGPSRLQFDYVRSLTGANELALVFPDWWCLGV